MWMPRGKHQIRCVREETSDECTIEKLERVEAGMIVKKSDIRKEVEASRRRLT